MNDVSKNVNLDYLRKGKKFSSTLKLQNLFFAFFLYFFFRFWLLPAHLAFFIYSFIIILDH